MANARNGNRDHAMQGRGVARRRNRYRTPLFSDGGDVEININAAKELNVQVFATTHSSDCVYGLAHVSETDPNHLVTVQRIDSGKRKSVAYSDTEIRIAAEREIEVR